MLNLDPTSSAVSASLVRPQGSPASTAQDTAPSDPDEANPNGITLTISPSADNVSTGDRSQNSVVVTLTTPNQQVQTEVTREQVIDTYAQRNENRTNEQIIDNTVGGVGNNPNPLQQAIIGNVIDSGQLDRQTGVDLLATRLTYNAAQTALDAFNSSTTSGLNNSTDTQDPFGINGITNAQSAQELASQALVASTRQALLFSDTAATVTDASRQNAIETYRNIESFT